MEIFRKTKKCYRLKKIKTHCIRNKEYIMRLDMAEERTSELKNMTIKTSQTGEAKSKRIFKNIQKFQEL